MPNLPDVVRPSIPEPTTTVGGLHATAKATKEAVEIMQGQRGTSQLQAVVRWQDLVQLGLVGMERVPKR